MPEEERQTKWTIARSAVKASTNFKKASRHQGEAVDPQRELLDAANNGDAHRIQLVLSDSGVDVNFCGQGRDGKYPALHLAALRGHTHAVNLLLASKAQVNQQAEFDHTALHLACYNNHPDTVDALLRAGAKMELASKAGWTPIFWTCTNHCPEALVKLLLAGANVNAVTPEGWTPLHKACEYGLKCIIRALLRAGAIDDAKTIKGETPLDVGLTRGHKELRPIFDHIRSMRQKGEEERKALHAADGKVGQMMLVKLQKKGRMIAEAARRKFGEDRKLECGQKEPCRADTLVALRDAADVQAERAWMARRMQKRLSRDGSSLSLNILGLGPRDHGQPDESSAGSPRRRFSIASASNAAGTQAGRRISFQGSGEASLDATAGRS